MDERTTGLILRTRLLTETSLIVHWLTPDYGRVATVAKGARRPNSPFRGKLDLFYLAEITYVRSRRSQLHTLREIGLRELHPRLRQELQYIRQAVYCAALIELATEEETPLPTPFALLAGLLRHLTGGPPQPITVFAFEMKLLDDLGLRPDFGNSALSAGTRQILKRLSELDWPLLSRLAPSDAQTREIATFLRAFIEFHLGKIPTGRDSALFTA